ncbi:MAG: hypothetical protein PUG10_07060 [Lachnospiraceae bacterium]|nr:hypothetical protein [Lachnospiraceae bacterium]
MVSIIKYLATQGIIAWFSCLWLGIMKDVIINRLLPPEESVRCFMGQIKNPYC